METAPKDVEPVQVDQTETPLESLASICTVLAIGLFVMTFIFQNFEIPSASMEKTLLIGDHVLVDRVTLAPPTSWAPFLFHREVKRGDIIVFLKPNPETPDLYLVKRAIGIPGDHIHLHNGIVYLNGVAQNEPMAGMPAEDGNPQHAFNAYRDDFPTVPPGPMEEGEVTASWANDLPNHIQGDDLVVPPARSSPWATTAPKASMAATGASSPAKTSSAAPCSSTGRLKPPPIRSTSKA